MTAYVATTNQNIDEVGYRFYAPIVSSRNTYSSVNGFTWTSYSNVNDAAVAWTGFAFGDELAVFIAANRTVTATTSPEATGGAVNRTLALPAGAAWKGCAFGNHTFVTINTSTTSAAYFRPRANIDWTVSTLPSAAAWNLVAFGNNTFVTVAASSTSSAYSTDDGATWSPSTLPASLNWSDLKYYNGTFILIANGSRDIYTSTDGQSWTLITDALPSTAAWSKISWASMGGANGTWVVVPGSGDASAYSTDNGATWTSTTLPASANWLVGGGKAPWDGRQMFVALTVSSTNAAFSTDGINWTPSVITSGVYLGVFWIEPKIMTGDTVQINNGAILTVNTDQVKAVSGATACVITNGKLRIENTSTSTPIRFVTNKVTTAAALNTINAASGLSVVEVAGDYIQIGTSTGASGQTFTSPYVYGDYIPTLEVETGNGTGVYEPWVNVTGASDFQTFKYIRNGFKSVSNGDAGTCFTQDFNQSAVQYLNLANCKSVPNTNVIKCDSTAGLVPGTWITGRGLAALTFVQEIISSTIFTTNQTVSAANTFANIPMIGILPICSQYTTTLRFGDGTNGAIPPNGARIRVQNILLTDISTPNFQISNYGSTNAGCYFYSPFGGVFSFDKCLFGESYSNYTQAAALTITNCGGAYVPYAAECYQVVLNNVAFGLRPSNMCLAAAPTALAAGSVSGTTLTTPATNALIPGVLITGTAGLHACVISSITNNTTATISVAAHTNGATTISYYGVWVMREHRMNVSNNQASGSTFSSIAWPYISNASFTNIVLTHGGHLITGSNTNPALGTGTGGAFSTSYSNNVTVNGLKVIAVGSYPRTRPYANAISTSVSGLNQTYSNIKIYNMSDVLTASAVNGITVSNITHKIGLNNEGYGWISGYRAFTDPENATFLANDTKYWFKTRSYRSHNFADTTNYIDGMKMCAVMSAPEKYKLMPQRMGALPAWSTTIAPTMAYGNGVWVILDGAVSGSSCIVSEDDGATWTTYMMPQSAGTTQWRNVIWCPTQNYFMAIQGGGVASTIVAYSTNGKDWSTVTTAPASATWQSLAFDNSQATNKWVGVAGGGVASTAGTRATITNGSIVFAATTLASAQWIDVASSGAGRYVAIAGGSAVGTATSWSNDGATWTAGGAHASSLWQSVAYGNGTFCAISSSSTTGPTACSADGVAWTAGTAPTLPAGMVYNKVIYTGTAFVLLAGTPPLNTANPMVSAAVALNASQCYVVSTSNTATSVTWGSIKYLPDYTHWISMTNNGNAVGVISTQTGKFAYTADITAGTPTWTLTESVYPVWNRISLLDQATSYTTAGATIASVATTAGSTTVTCTSTATLYVGAVITLNQGNCNAAGAVYFGTPAVGSNVAAVIVTSITNATTFVINKPAMKDTTGGTLTIYKHAYQIFRSTTEGFTARDETTLLGTTLGTGSTGALIDDTFGVVKDTPYHYRVRKLSGSQTVANCSGTASASTITTTFTNIPNPTTGFYYWNYSYDIEGKNGTDIISSLSFNFYAVGVIPGSIVTGAGIPVGTTVAEVIDFDTVRLSANLTADVVNRGTNRTYVGFSPAPDMYVYGSNVGMDCQVVSVDSNTSMTVSVANTNTFSNQTLRFVVGFELPEITCIPQAPVMYMNNALQSQAIATTPWTASGVTVTNASGQLAPYDNFLGLNGNATASAVAMVATANNGTVTQTVQTGVGTSHTFAIYARANIPNNTSYITMKMDLGTTSETKTLTNQWTRYSVTFTTTAATTNAVITIPAMGSNIQVAHATVTRTSGIPTTIAGNALAATTTYPIYLFPQQLLNPSNGLYGWNIDGGGGIETNLLAVPTSQLWAHLHLGASSSFTPTDQNQLFSTMTPGAGDPIISVGTSAANVTVSNYQPYNTKQIHHGMLVLGTTGATNVNVKDSTYTINGSAGYICTSSPAYNMYLHNIDVINIRPYITAFYLDTVNTTNASVGVKYQNIRSNRQSRSAWYSQSLDTQMRGVFGANPYPIYNANTWNLSTEPTYSGLQITSQAVYDSMFHEFTYGTQNKGCLDVRLIASSKASKPYTITSGVPYFTNDGNLALTNAGEQVVIEWTHFIKGLTGFTKRLPHIYSTDLGLNLTTSLCALIEYDLDKGSGYSGTWKQLNGFDGMNNLAAETGISPSIGVKPKFRITARYGLKYAAKVGQFVPGWTIQNAITSPTATAVVVADEIVTGVTGTLIATDITGEWLPTNTIYSGTMNSTATATTNATATTTGSNITGTTFTVGTQTGGTVAEGMKLTGTGVTAGTYIISNISGSGSGSTWLVNISHAGTGSQSITGTNNLITLASNANFFVGCGVVLIGATFGGITSGTIYYVSEVIGSTQIAVATNYNNSLVATNVALTNSSGSVPIAGRHSTITAVNTAFVFAPQPTSRLNSFRLFTEVDTSTDYNYAYSTASLTLTGLKTNTEVRVYRTSDLFELGGTENSGTTYTLNYDYYADTEVYIVIHSLDYIPIRLEGITLGASNQSIPVQQQRDRQYLNP